LYPVNVSAEYEVRDLPVYEIIAIEFWGGVKPNLGEGVAVDGRGWYRSKEG